MQKGPDDIGVSFASERPEETALWQELAEFPADEPTEALRRRFYSQLDRENSRARRSTFADGIGRFLGLNNAGGWLAVAAALLLGIALGRALPERANSASVGALEQQVANLRRDLILDRLESAAPSKRLRGVIDAVSLADRDPEIASALLDTATADSVQAVRTAAIDALGSQVRAGHVGDALMRELESSDSPLVQLALIDLVLRHGTPAQLRTLLALAREGDLHPDLVEHVLSSVSEERA